MALIANRGLHLVAHSLWRNAAAARLAIGRGDFRAAFDHVNVIRMIAANAQRDSVKRLAHTTLTSLRRQANGFPAAGRPHGDCA